MEHPKLGKLNRILMEHCWEGMVLDQYELYIDELPVWDENGNYREALDPDCEALAIKELADLNGLLTRIEVFLKTASESYLDTWGYREWKLSYFIATKREEKAVFIVNYYLLRDDYNVWQIFIEQGNPVSISRR